MKLAHDNYHSILDEPWKYEVVGFEYKRILDEENVSVRLILERDSKQVTLEFDVPLSSGILGKIEILNPCSLYIKDNKDKGWDGATIEVGDLDDYGPFFYANSVRKVEKNET